MSLKATTPNVFRAEGEAWKVSDSYGFAHPRELPLIAVARDLGIKVRIGGMNGAEGRLVRRGDRGIIRIRDTDISSGRARFALSHELGHWKLHTQSQGFTCSAAELRDYKKDPAEVEANRFAAELLMPRAFVSSFTKNRDLNLDTSFALAAECNVSLTAAAIRIMQTTKHECFLAFSDGRHMHWWVSQTNRYGIWMQSAQAIHPESGAYHVSESDRRIFYDEVPADFWFPHFLKPETLSISEESIHLKIARGVLTLLVISSAD